MFLGMHAPTYTILERSIFNSVDSDHMDYKIYIFYNCSCLRCVRLQITRYSYALRIFFQNKTTFTNFCYQKQLKKHVKLQ